MHETQRRSSPSTSRGSPAVPVTSVARTLCDLTAVVADPGSSSARSTKRCGARSCDLDDIAERRRTTRRAEDDVGAP